MIIRFVEKGTGKLLGITFDDELSWKLIEFVENDDNILIEFYEKEG